MYNAIENAAIADLIVRCVDQIRLNDLQTNRKSQEMHLYRFFSVCTDIYNQIKLHDQIPYEYEQQFEEIKEMANISLKLILSSPRFRVKRHGLRRKTK
jgi:hypothetical protein